MFIMECQQIMQVKLNSWICEIVIDVSRDPLILKLMKLKGERLIWEAENPFVIKDKGADVWQRDSVERKHDLRQISEQICLLMLILLYVLLKLWEQCDTFLLFNVIHNEVTGW